MNLRSAFLNPGLKVAPGDVPDPVLDTALTTEPGRKRAVLAGGCFWCVEAVYRDLEGVLSITSGYSGGTQETADYKTVCTGETDHAEVVDIAYDPSVTSFGQILKIFFAIAHDPTQKNRQGNDVGRQYRSAVFYADAEQMRVTQEYIRQLDAAAIFGAPIATEIVPLEAFYAAEAYHHDYAARNPGQPYIAGVAMPKVAKLRQYYGDRLKAR
jgi:peptide-methionine (S)-S-oxide reductase